jgi:uncharacterized protein
MAKKLLFALLSGALFALGLVVSGMTQPPKVIGFLNVGGIFAVTPRAGRKPWVAPKFELSTRKDIDGKLLIGAALFGIGWGLVGYCPGPALASLLYGGLDVVVFAAALALGMWAARRFVK